MAKNKKRVVTTDTPGLTSNPFAGLADIDVAPSRDDEPGAESQAAETATAEVTSGAPAGPAVRRAVVRYQRKGRGGKEVTAVELRGLPPSDLGDWLTDLKKRLGCGGFLEGELIVLAGDQRQRLRDFLESAGVAKISVG